MNESNNHTRKTDFKKYILKFSKKEYLESLKNGYVYFKEIQHFRNVETEGQADSRESKIRIRSLDGFKIVENETIALLRKMHIPEMNFSRKDMTKTPIFSSVLIDEMIIERINGNEIILKRSFIEEMKKWDATIMIIDLEEFLDKINKRCKQLGIFCASSKVVYEQEKDIFDGADIQEVLSHDLFRQIFYKRSEFANQNEFRITVLNEKNDLIPTNQDHYILKIDLLENCAILELSSIEDLGIRMF
jgi:uncharacterized protein YlzI (FlbEa/FlbD family)